MFEKLFSDKGLSVERLNALVRLNECGSLIKAAENDKGRQSRYSHYLKELSAFFGVELTVRVGKVIRLTAAGAQLAQIVQEHFQSLLDFRQNARKESHVFRFGAEADLLQWMVVPTIGTLRRSDNPFRFSLQSLPTKDTIENLQSQRLDFGLVRTDAVPAGLKRAPIATISYAAVIPERLVPKRGLLTLKNALFDCPHAATGGDDQTTQRLDKLAESLGGRFCPELICDSVAQCIIAVKSGYYASVIPLQSWIGDSKIPCQVVEGAFLDGLNQMVALAWHPRVMDVRGDSAKRVKDMLLGAVKRGAAIT